MVDLQTDYDGCPLCGGKDSLLRSVNCQRHPLWHEPLPRLIVWKTCTSCAHVFTRGFWTPAGLIEVFSKHNPEQVAGGRVRPDVQRATWAPVVDRVLRLLGGYRTAMGEVQAPSWLDVGCGDGCLLMTASDVGFSAIGLDARAEAVKRIKGLGYTAHEGEFANVSTDGKLDVLSMMDVLEHLPFPVAALTKAADLLRPGGVFVASMPDMACSTWRLMDRLDKNNYWIELEHHHNFTRRRLIELLRETGFDVADFTTPNRYAAQMEIYALRR